MQNKLLNDILIELQNRLKREELTRHWKVSIGTSPNKYLGVRLEPVTLLGNQKALCIVLEKEGARIFKAVRVINPASNGEYGDIADVVLDLKNQIKGNDPKSAISNGWWLTYRYIDDIDLNDNEILLRIASDNTLAVEIAEIVWGFYSDLRARIEDVNRSLATRTNACPTVT